VKTSYTEDELRQFNNLRVQGCAVCTFLPSELGSMSADNAEQIMCSAVNDQVEVPDPEQDGYDGSEDHNTEDRNPNRNGDSR